MQLTAKNTPALFPYFGFRNNLIYRFSKHLVSRCIWQFSKQPDLTIAQQQVVDDLNKNGIAFADLTTFGIDNGIFKVLMTESESVAEARFLAEQTSDPSKSKFRKDFWYKLLGHGVIRPTQPDIFSRISLTPSLLRTVNQYLRCYSWLMDYNLWLNLPVNAEAKSSQMWHRDHVIHGPDGTYSKKTRKIVKVFIYLHDVSVETGALTYLAGSQKGGPLQNLEPPKAIVEDTMAARVADEVMERHASKEKWIRAAGKAGTVVFFDASGYHKGGLVEIDKRLLFKLEYGSWLWLNPLYPKVHIDNLHQYKFGGLPELRWASSIMDFFPRNPRSNH